MSLLSWGVVILHDRPPAADSSVERRARYAHIRFTTSTRSRWARLAPAKCRPHSRGGEAVGSGVAGADLDRQQVRATRARAAARWRRLRTFWLGDWPWLRALLAGGAVPGRMRVTATPVPGSWPAARSGSARGRCPSYQPAQRVVVLASHATFPQPLRVNGAEDGSASSFGHRDLDLHQTPSVHDDALELLGVHQNRDELTFVKGLHFAEPTRLGASSARAPARPGRPAAPGAAACPG